MKRKILALLLIVIPSILWSQTTTWKLGIHPFSDTEAKTQIDGIISQGFYPVSLQINPGEAITLLYTKNSIFKTPLWVIQFFPKEVQGARLQEQITALITQGWTPKDLALTDQGMYLLFVRGQRTINAFRIEARPAGNLQENSLLIQDYINRGFSPVGLAYFNNMLYTLFIKDSQGVYGAVHFKTSPNDGKAYIDLLSSQTTLIPWAMAVSPTTVYSLFLERK